MFLTLRFSVRTGRTVVVSVSNMPFLSVMFLTVKTGFNSYLTTIMILRMMPISSS